MVLCSGSEIKANISQQESDQEEEEEMEEEEGGRRPRKKKSLDPFRFFQEMRIVGSTLPTLVL